MFLAGVAGFIENAVSLFGGEPLVPHLDEQASEVAKFRREGLGSGGARAYFAGEVQGIAHDNPDDAESAGKTRKGAQILAGAAAALEREHRLGGEAQLVGNSDTDAFRSDIEREEARRAGCVRHGTLHFQLIALQVRGLLAGEWLQLQWVKAENPEKEDRVFNYGKVLEQGMARRRRKSGKQKGFGAAGILLVLFLAVLAAAGAVAWLVLTPYGPQSETFVEVPPGTSMVRIGKLLEGAGVVRSRYAFDLVRSVKRGRLKAGEYRFDHPATPLEVYERIARGDVYTIALTIPEGANIFDIAARLEQAGFGAQQTFLDVVTRQTSLVADLDPRAKSLEGYLFPDTYHFARKASAEQIAAAMVKRFRQAASRVGLKENVHAVVTIASLVERETAVDAERPLVASVFQNRLTRNMPLMTDPSVIYGLELQRLWRGTIYASDLKRDTPYNTYMHAGLPPGPVANPGLPSLQAAMQPARTDYLYFVAAGDNPQGKSVFSTTLEEHQRNVEGYRHAMKKAGGR